MKSETRNSELETRNLSLDEKIRTRTIRAGIIGLGYVGLPLAVEFARAGVEVTCIDLDPAKISSIRRGESYIQDVPTQQLEKLVVSEKIHATSDFSVIRNLDTINI